MHILVDSYRKRLFSLRMSPKVAHILGEQGEKHMEKNETTTKALLFDALFDTVKLTRDASVFLEQGDNASAHKLLELADSITFPMQLLLADLEKVEKLPNVPVRSKPVIGFDFASAINGDADTIVVSTPSLDGKAWNTRFIRKTNPFRFDYLNTKGFSTSSSSDFSPTVTLTK